MSEKSPAINCWAFFWEAYYYTPQAPRDRERAFTFTHFSKIVTKSVVALRGVTPHPTSELLALSLVCALGEGSKPPLSRLQPLTM